MSETLTDECRRILAYLARASRRDAEWDGSGLRDTSEIAAAAALPTAETRRLLRLMGERNLVDEYERLGAHIPWTITPAGRAALEGDNHVE